MKEYIGHKEVEQILIYVCKVKKKGIRIILLFKDGNLGIFELEFPKSENLGVTNLNDLPFQEFDLDDYIIKKIIKNVKGKGIICHFYFTSNRILYLTNKFLSNLILNGLIPYVILSNNIEDMFRKCL